MNNETRPSRNNWLRSRGGLVLLGFLAIAVFFLFTEHRAHLFGALPYLLLACILLHLFGHGGHGEPKEHEGDRHSDSGRERP
ncbi:MAG: DUF2933 domain-containing protein [Nitrospirae bacterium]|nr:DUF2933 domain-containing protein [Nitrospirota bacterium]